VLRKLKFDLGRARHYEHAGADHHQENLQHYRHTGKKVGAMLVLKMLSMPTRIVFGVSL